MLNLPASPSHGCQPHPSHQLSDPACCSGLPILSPQSGQKDHLKHESVVPVSLLEEAAEASNLREKFNPLTVADEAPVWPGCPPWFCLPAHSVTPATRTLIPPQGLCICTRLCPLPQMLFSQFLCHSGPSLNVTGVSKTTQSKVSTPPQQTCYAVLNIPFYGLYST